MLHAITATAITILLTTPIWMGKTLPQALNRITHVYMATYLGTIAIVAVTVGPSPLVTAAFLAPVAAWLSTDAVYGSSPWRTGGVVAVVAAGVALYAAGYSAASLVPAIGWFGAIPVLISGYAGWAAFTADTRQKTFAA